ncbi:MAG: glycosyltransferase family 39 protein [Rhodopseudomonas palustris]|nr:glycosyltransferase family 39 protein [Rhodopseudomonas palustris]
MAWSRELAFGYDKHPPFSAVVAKAWLTLFPVSDLSPASARHRQYRADAVHRLADACAVTWSPDKTVFGLALLMLIPFFNFIALKYNANAVLLPLWALTIDAFLRAYQHAPGDLGGRCRRLGRAVDAGQILRSAVLVATLGLAALLPIHAAASSSGRRRRG